MLKLSGQTIISCLIGSVQASVNAVFMEGDRTENYSDPTLVTASGPDLRAPDISDNDYPNDDPLVSGHEDVFLSEETIDEEIQKLFDKKGLNPKTATVEDIEETILQGADVNSVSGVAVCDEKEMVDDLAQETPAGQESEDLPALEDVSDCGDVSLSLWLKIPGVILYILALFLFVGAVIWCCVKARK